MVVSEVTPLIARELEQEKGKRAGQQKTNPVLQQKCNTAALNKRPAGTHTRKISRVSFFNIYLGLKQILEVFSV